MRVYESNGPDVKIRGTAYQVTEKYEALAKDAETSGNIVLAENYRQHAEHYQRIISSFADETPVNADKMQNTVNEVEEETKVADETPVSEAEKTVATEQMVVA